jgi:hypothetical protein
MVTHTVLQHLGNTTKTIIHNVTTITHEAHDKHYTAGTTERVKVASSNPMCPDDFATFDNIWDFVWLGCAALCVISAALAAGLTMGLLSLDTLKLKIKAMTGTPEERRYAKQILPLLSDHHFLLCTLLIFNAAANEALPIFLDYILPSWAGK